LKVEHRKKRTKKELRIEKLLYLFDQLTPCEQTLFLWYMRWLSWRSRIMKISIRWLTWQSAGYCKIERKENEIKPGKR
jgi:hypothetical protein